MLNQRLEMPTRRKDESEIPACVDLQQLGNDEAVTPLRIVGADDNRDATENLAMFLALDGHAVKTAHDGH